jgi:hypothetical protein
MNGDEFSPDIATIFKRFCSSVLEGGALPVFHMTLLSTS